jgi:hypothetical protein
MDIGKVPWKLKIRLFGLKMTTFWAGKPTLQMKGDLSSVNTLALRIRRLVSVLN